ncbi:hypothetical protein ACS0TY_008668 [Phlomoides rotata]
MEGGGARQGKAEPSRGRRPHQIFCMNSNLEMTMLIQRACLWQLSLNQRNKSCCEFPDVALLQAAAAHSFIVQVLSLNLYDTPYIHH